MVEEIRASLISKSYGYIIQATHQHKAHSKVTIAEDVQKLTNYNAIMLEIGEL